MNPTPFRSPAHWAATIAFSFLAEIAAYASPLEPVEAAAALNTPPGITATLFAAEPMLTNPTNIDIDERGRVWVCDVMNYRGNQGSRPEGDRILILEDSDGDGSADTSKVFYQGIDVDSALGICVLPRSEREPLRVIVSASPNVWLFTDDDGDDLPDHKEAIYTDTGDKQHDHSAHAFVFGPDGRFYWNMGDKHHGAFDKDGHVLVDQFGRAVRPDGNPYRRGMAFRSDLDGGPCAVLAHNLRNSYELTVNAFGEVWFSDNDDDGNQGTRICFGMEGGNYGYTDEMTGESWRVDGRLGADENIARRHWHQNDPGVIPNVANMGNGSPSGIVFYEADLLRQLSGKLIHCEPGRSVVRAFTIATDGAGYAAEAAPLVDGGDDQWFRPVDVAIAPDGSVFIADWYDPGVGGHRQAETTRGRIYRIAPAEASRYTIPKFDCSTPAGACDALSNGCQSIRVVAWGALSEMGANAESALSSMTQSGDASARTRAYWLLSRLDDGANFIRAAAEDADPRVRCAAIRMARERGEGLVETLVHCADDPSPLVRRECAVALREVTDIEKARPIWRKLVSGCHGGDRWMLEALGLAADGRWDSFFLAEDAWQDTLFENPQRLRDLIWRSRGSTTTVALVKLLADPKTPENELTRLLRAIDFQSNVNKDAPLAELLQRVEDLPRERRALIVYETLQRVQSHPLDASTRKVLVQYLREAPRDERFMRLVQQFEIAEYYDALLDEALSQFADANLGVEALRFLLDHDGAAAIETRLNHPGGLPQLVRMLANANHEAVSHLLLPFAIDAEQDPLLAREAIRAVAASRCGAIKLIELAEQQKLTPQAIVAVAYAVRASRWKVMRERADRLHPDAPEAETEQLPVDEWMAMDGDIGRGEQLFFAKANCGNCHAVHGRGIEIGPSLSEIGRKLSRRGLYESMLYPSAAISHSYEAYAVVTQDGVAVTGVLVGETDDAITLKTDKNVVVKIPRDEIESRERLTVSLMPAALHRLLSPQEIADVAAYLESLKPALPVP